MESERLRWCRRAAGLIIGGLLSSTFLTLIVVPAAYWLVERLRARLGGRAA